MKNELQKELLWATKLMMPIKKTFKSKLVSKRAKLKLYWAIIRLLITYASETWVLKESMKRKFIIPERKILTHSLP